MWASGSLASPRLSLPRDPLASVGWQMLLGGAAITLVGLAIGEGSDVHVDAFSTRSLLALVLGFASTALSGGPALAR